MHAQKSGSFDYIQDIIKYGSHLLPFLLPSLYYRVSVYLRDEKFTFLPLCWSSHKRLATSCQLNTSKGT
jgi:hypothetical protein